MSTLPGSRSSATVSVARLRLLAQLLSAALAAAYLVLFLLVRDAERAEPENTFGAYVFLFLAYAACAVALTVWRGPVVALAAAALQVAVLVLFVVFGMGLLGPGVFAYDVVRPLHMPVWAAGITTAEVVLLAVLVRLVGVGARRYRARHG